MTLAKKVARLRLVAEGLRGIQEFESATYLDEYAAHLSQPHPVAQGEAVAWQRRDRITHGGGDAPGWSHWREVGRYEFDEHNGKYPPIEFRELYATPALPTGHRIVPVEPTEAMRTAGYLYGKDPVSSYKAMLGALSDDGVR